MNILVLAVALLVASLQATAQQSTVVNLVTNGSFEKGNFGFKSDYRYSKDVLMPGYYSVTRQASSLNNDYKDPVNGDHTSGYGNYFIVDSDGKKGKKAWCSTVEVIPNSIYTITVYFCNLYKHKGSNFGMTIGGTPTPGLPSTGGGVQIGGHPKGNDCKIKFTVNGEQAGETDKDIFHMFRWVRATAEWYSGLNEGPVDFCIENVNYRESGNDLAMDDIEFLYVKTMPKGYKPPKRETIMLEENNTPAFVDKRIRLVKENRPLKFNEIQIGDSLGPGIFSLYPQHPTTITNDTTLKIGQKIELASVSFAQSSSDLTIDAAFELDRLATWLKRNPTLKIRLEGHTDNQGKPELNVKLSQERVDNVKQYLIVKGISASRMECVGYGGEYPIADNANEETRKLNRRVEFEIIGK